MNNRKRKSQAVLVNRVLKATRKLKAERAQAKRTPATRRKTRQAATDAAQVSDEAFSIKQEDGSHIICDPAMPLTPGCKVVVIYPKRKGEPRRASTLGTLESKGEGGAVEWVTFPLDDDTERRCRIDQSKGHVIVRAVSVTSRLPANKRHSDGSAGEPPASEAGRVVDGIFGSRFAVTCGKPGDYYVADPAAPLKHGCHVVVLVAPGRWYTEGKVHTKHPDRTKTLAVEMEGGHVRRGVERPHVARVVGQFVATAAWRRGTAR